MYLGHLGVAVADRIGQCGRSAAATEQNLVRSGRCAPEPVVAGQQDLVALRVDGLHPELTAGHRHRAGQARAEPAGNVLDDVRRQQIVEQFTPGGVGLGKGHHRGLAAVHRLNTGDQVISGRIHHTGLADHLTPLVPEVVGRDGGVVGPGGFGPDLVGDGERVGRCHRGRDQQVGIPFPPGAGRGGRVGHRAERTGQHQRADGRGHRRLVAEQVRIESGTDRVDRHDDLSGPGRRCRRLRTLGALRRRGRVDGAAGEDRDRCQRTGGAQPARSPQHAPQGIGRLSKSPFIRPVTPSAPWPGTGCGPGWWRPIRLCAPGRSPG